MCLIELPRVISFQGQRSGAGPQKLISVNKNLFDCHKRKRIRIHFFTDFVYTGQVYIFSKPYTENGVSVSNLAKMVDLQLVLNAVPKQWSQLFFLIVQDIP